MNVKETDKKLFPEFPPIPTVTWEKQIQADLKGADYEKKLIWKTQDGLKIRPYYRAEDLEHLTYLHAHPGEFPFVRGTRSDDNHWEIRQDIETDDLRLANTIAVEAVERGAEGIGLNVKEIRSEKELGIILNNIDTRKISLHFKKAREYPFISELFIRMMKQRGIDAQDLKGSLGFDPFSYYLLHGSWYNSLEDNLNEAVYLVNLMASSLPGFRTIHVSGNIFEHAGATIAQELAYTLASGHEYLYRLTQKGLSVDQVAGNIHFTFAVGSNYFLEIAKIRAARLLWANIVAEYTPTHPVSAAMHIHGTTALWNKTVYDPYVNMLRVTTEAMAAAMAGCNSISVHPFDIAYSIPDRFSSRIARNTQIILKEESYLDKIVDPAAGSYYIENLTDILASAAWELFLQVEAEGGFLKAAESGYLRTKIEGAASQRLLEIGRRSSIILGTNQYPNGNETMLDKITGPVMKEYPGLKLCRGAMPFEALRLATERHVTAGNRRPLVFLFNTGNLAMRKARAAFSVNFFGCSGYEIIDPPGFAMVDEGVKAAAQSGADLVVICSSDEEYATLGTEAAEKLKKDNPNRPVIIAGNPVDLVEKLKEAGVDDFIHIRTNVIESLQQFSKRLGIV